MAIRSKLFSLFTLAFAVTAFTVVASAQETAPAPKEGDKKLERGEGKRGGYGRHGGKFGGRHGGPGMRELHGITLTDAQKEQLKAIHEANKPSQETIDQMKAFGEARRNGTLTDAQKEQMKQFREAQRAKMESVHSQILAILTPEQKAQLEQRKAEMKQRMEERRQLRQTKKAEAKPTDNN